MAITPHHARHAPGDRPRSSLKIAQPALVAPAGDRGAARSGTAVDSLAGRPDRFWTVNGPDGTIAVAGIDVVSVAADGRIQTAAGIFGNAEAVA
jgi:hypothetical protein